MRDTAHTPFEPPALHRAFAPGPGPAPGPLPEIRPGGVQGGRGDLHGLV